MDSNSISHDQDNHSKTVAFFTLSFLFCFGVGRKFKKFKKLYEGRGSAGKPIQRNLSSLAGAELERDFEKIDRFQR